MLNCFSSTLRHINMSCSTNESLVSLRHHRIKTPVEIVKMLPPTIDIGGKTNEMRTEAQTLNFMHSFRPVYYISRIFGLMPFTIIYHSNCEVVQSKVTILDALWLVTNVVSYSLSAFYLKINPGSVFFSLLANIFLKFGLFYSASVIAIDMCNRYKFIEIFKKFTTFDKEVSNLNSHSREFFSICLTQFIQMARVGMYLNYKQKCRRNWLYCTLPIIAAFGIMWISIAININDHARNEYFVFLQRAMVHASSLSFIIILHSLYERLAMINSHLR